MGEIEGLAAALTQAADSTEGHTEAAIAQADASVEVAKIQAEVAEHVSNNAIITEALRQAEPELEQYKSEHATVHALTNARLDDMETRLQAIEDAFYEVEQASQTETEETGPTPEPVEVEKPKTEPEPETQPTKKKTGGLYFKQ